MRRVKNNNHLFAGTRIGLFRSTDDGARWTKLENGLSASAFYALSFCKHGTVYAGTEQGVFRSDDDGQSWEKDNVGVNDIAVISLVTNDADAIFVGTQNGMVYVHKFADH